jgi:hypothetical protein
VKLQIFRGHLTLNIYLTGLLERIGWARDKALSTVSAKLQDASAGTIVVRLVLVVVRFRLLDWTSPLLVLWGSGTRTPCLLGPT